MSGRKGTSPEVSLSLCRTLSFEFWCPSLRQAVKGHLESVLRNALRYTHFAMRLHDPPASGRRPEDPSRFAIALLSFDLFSGACLRVAGGKEPPVSLLHLVIHISLLGFRFFPWSLPAFGRPRHKGVSSHLAVQHF